jgi:putative IMPACT (imprinted ancient) family translation regulator
VKLGAGGLVRAYTDAIARVLQDAPRVERIAKALLTVEISYPDEARVRRWIEQEGYTLADSGYEMEVRLTVSMPVTAVAGARGALRDMTQGRAVFPEES